MVFVFSKAKPCPTITGGGERMRRRLMVMRRAVLDNYTDWLVILLGV